MPGMVSVVLDRPISSVRVCGGRDDQEIQQAAAEQAKAVLNAEMQKIEAQKMQIARLTSAIEDAATKIDKLRKDAVTGNQKQIALLAVEIARKIILSEVEEGRYDIAAIIETALQASDGRDGATVRLSPEDYTTLEDIIKSGGSSFENVKFEADSSIPPAQCCVTTSKGVVEYFIEDQLNGIAAALSG